MAARLSARQILELLVAFDTTSTKSNLELIGWIADYLDGCGIGASLTHNEARTKANLFATIGPAEEGGVVLSGHSDVVPAEERDWHSDPFRVIEQDGKLYGRGTADMKGFIALALALVPDAAAARLRTPIHLAFSFDEEVGCLGVPALIAALPEGLARPRLAIIGEPTQMQVANAHKGARFLDTHVTGREAHASHPEAGLNAIVAAAEIIGEIARLANECRSKARPKSGFEPPYTSFNIGTVAGGSAINVIAKECGFAWEFRTLPEDDPDALQRRIEHFIEADLLPRLRHAYADAAIATTARVMVPPLVPQPGSPAERLARQLTGANRSTTIAFATEAGHFQRAGIPAIICGPGSIGEAHQPNEFLALDQLAAGALFLDRLLQECRKGLNR